LPKIISKVQLTTMPSSLTDTLSSGTAGVPSQGHKGSHYSRAPVKMGSLVTRVLWRQGEDEEEGERPQADRREDRCPQEEAEEEGGRMSPPVPYIIASWTCLLSPYIMASWTCQAMPRVAIKRLIYIASLLLNSHRSLTNCQRPLIKVSRASLLLNYHRSLTNCSLGQRPLIKVSRA
jgi:hypothetical protein